MTAAEQLDRLFEMATGWLGWPPDVVLNTPIPQIELAIRGKIEFVKATNPFGSGDRDGDGKNPAVPSGPVDRGKVAADIRKTMRSLAGLGRRRAR